MHLPECILIAHVWPRVHQLGLSPSIHAIKKAGPSLLEDRVDLITISHVCEKIQQFRGWSQRVTEFHRSLYCK